MTMLNKYEGIADLRRGGLDNLDLTRSRVDLIADDILPLLLYYLPRSASSLVSINLRFSAHQNQNFNHQTRSGHERNKSWA